MSRIIISDVHGCIKTLLALVEQLPKGVPLTFAGDNVDQGPGSRQVLDFVKEGGHDCVVGNHEQMLLDDLKFRTRDDGTEQFFVDIYHSAWMGNGNGGSQTLQSYLVDGVHDVPAMKTHVAWLKTLPYYLHYEDLKNDKGMSLLVTHTTAASVWGRYSPEDPIFKNEVIWARKDIPKKIKGIYSVYGHTPQEFKATMRDHYACIDTGAVYKGHGRYSKLTALQYPEMVLFEQENCE